MKKKVNKVFQQFPNIFRFIPEDRYFKAVIKSKPTFYFVIVFLILISFAIISLLIISGIGMINDYKQVNSLINNRKRLESQINFWKSIASQYEGYKDAYFQIAVLEYQLGSLNKASVANNKVLFLDPNSTDGKKLQKILERENN